MGLFDKVKNTINTAVNPSLANSNPQTDTMNCSEESETIIVQQIIPDDVRSELLSLDLDLEEDVN